MREIKIAEPIIGSEEIGAVKNVLLSGMLSQGSKVTELEQRFAKYCGVDYAIAVNSGTAAIHSALFAVGIGPGDEVITVSFSFIATINPILMLGARPVLVDIKLETFNIDVELVEAAITPKTKAIIPVDLYGQPYEYSRLKEIADKHGLKIIEDACQAVGAEYGGNKTGMLGDIGCFSLYATKNIMSAEGGIVTTSNKKYAEAIKRFRQHGMTGTYDYAHLGYNYRMTDIQAAIALEQLKKVDRFNSIRKSNAERLNEGLQGIGGIVLPVIAPNRTHVFHQYTIRVTDEFPLTRDALAHTLLDEGVTTGVYYPRPLYTYKHIANALHHKPYSEYAEIASRQVLSLPVHPKVSKAQIAHIVKVVNSI